MRIVKNRYASHLLFALVLLLLASSITVFILFNSRSAMAAEVQFKDIPLDHPVYQMCRQMLYIGAIKPRAGMSLAPFEKVSAAEWNFALHRVGEHLGRVIPHSALFAADDEISGRSMLLRLQNLADDSCGISSAIRIDHSRLAAFFILERCLLDYINE